MTTENWPKGPSGIALPITGFSRAIDKLINGVGELASLMWPMLVIVITLQVFARYALGRGSIAMEELQWHLYAIGFMLGMAITEIRERNVRIDVLAEKFSYRTRLRIELFGIVCFLIPVCSVVLWFAAPFFWTSFQLSEISASPGGLPYRWFLKSFIPSSFILLLLAAISRLSRVIQALRQQ
jgi:TRAP-type mannitol/chloroaromatic compound transport system permease small subunit